MTEAKILVNQQQDIAVGQSSQLAEFWTHFKKNRAAVLGLGILVCLILVALFAPYLAPYNPYQSNMPESLKAPGQGHLLGTDELGRDIFTRIIYGSRISLKVGILAVSVALTIGVILGAIAGYYGGIIDNTIMRAMDIMLAFPSLLLAIAFMTALGRGIENAIIAIGIVSTPHYARIVRGSVLAVKENEYIQAARAMGASDLRIIFYHVLPNVLSPIVIRATLGISTAILETAALGFLGLGVQPPFAEWGAMLGSGRGYFYNAPHIVLYPGLAITITVLAFNLLGDGLRDVLDPRLKQ